MAGEFIQTEDGRIYFEIQGKGEPLLLLHAGSLTGGSWQPYLEGFAEHFRVITPDLPAHGQSDTPAGAMSYRRLADAMAAFVRAVGAHKPLIVGFSDGGQAALEIGMRHPELPQCLVVGGAWFKFSERYREWVREAIGDERLPQADTARLARNHPDWAAWLEHLYGPDRWQPLLTRLKPMWTTPLNYTAGDFARVTAPTLLLIGDRDELVAIEETAEMYRLLPVAEIGIVPGADHGAFFSSKRAVFQSLMLEFLLRRRSSAS